MSHFLREFDALREEYKAGSATRVFEIADLDKGTLSHIRNRGRKVQFDDLLPLSAAIGSDEMIYLRLLCARLRDECTDPRARRITIDINGGPNAIHDENETLPPDFPQLPTRFQRAIRNIAANVTKDAGLRSTVLWFGEDLFGKEPNSPGQQAAAEIVGAAVDEILEARGRKPRKSPTGGVKYTIPRRSKNKPTGASDAT